MNTKQILIAARDVIKNPENWTTDVAARDSKGKEVDPKSEEAVCFCTFGALRKVTTHQHQVDRASALLWNFMTVGIAQYNDDHTHEEVLNKIDQAISSIKE